MSHVFVLGCCAGTTIREGKSYSDVLGDFAKGLTLGTDPPGI
jgi:hypothetical protein